MRLLHCEFWREQPALLLGISFLIGIGSALFHLPLWLAALWLSYCLFLKRWAAGASLFLAALYSHLLYGSLPLIEKPLFCKARFAIHSLQPHQSPFHRDLQYRGTLYYAGKALPCALYHPLENRPSASSDYLLTGELSQKDSCSYSFKAKEWEPIRRTFSLAELRYGAKKKFREFLKKKLSHPKTASFLSSLASGDVDDRQLRYEFGRLGLQHILAISGFHFGVLIAFCSYLLSLFFPLRIQWLTLLLLTTLYYIFIGSSPAVQRAYITALLYLLSKLLGRPATAANLLGGALLIELILDPLAAASLGFQLSFICCAGILLFYPPLLRLLKIPFPSRPLSLSSRLPPLSQIVYLLSTTFRSAIGLTLAVNLAILPLLLHHFGKFPYLSLLYNLFFPLFASAALSLLLLALLLQPLLPPLASPLFHLLDTATTHLLLLTSHPPLPLDYSLYAPPFPSYLIPLYLFALFLFSIQKGRSQFYYC